MLNPELLPLPHRLKPTLPTSVMLPPNEDNHRTSVTTDNTSPQPLQRGDNGVTMALALLSANRGKLKQVFIIRQFSVLFFQC